MWPSQSPDLGGNTSSTDRLQLIWALELVRVRMKRGPTSALTPITSIATTATLNSIVLSRTRNRTKTHDAIFMKENKMHHSMWQ